MCGIVGYLDKSGSAAAAVGGQVLRMLEALACRGPDSAGVALWGPESDRLIVRIKIIPGETGGSTGPSLPPDAARMPARDRSGAAGARVSALDHIARRFGRVRARTIQGALVRLEIATAQPVELARAIESIDADVEVVSMGRRLEIVKQVGAPKNLDAAFGVSGMTGTHGLGHTRLSTESRVDLSHSQPFWAHGTPDLAVVHNGHITNYHRLRRMFEQEGVRFYTENDSEIIGIYLARRLAEGASLREALAASVRELDGSFSYLAATAGAFGFAKDPFCLKPLIVGEGDGAIAVATEEIALQAALAGPYTAREAGAGAVSVWDVSARPESDRGRAAIKRTRGPGRSRRAA